MAAVVPCMCVVHRGGLGNHRYLVLGTLRDQIIYPDTASMMQEKGISDDDLLVLLREVCFACAGRDVYMELGVCARW